MTEQTPSTDGADPPSVEEAQAPRFSGSVDSSRPRTHDLAAALKDPTNSGSAVTTDEEFGATVPTPAGEAAFRARLREGSAQYAAVVMLTLAGAGVLWLFASGYLFGRIDGTPWWVATLVGTVPGLALMVSGAVFAFRGLSPLTPGEDDTNRP